MSEGPISEREQADAPAVSGLSSEEAKKRRQRSLALALALGLFVIIVFFVTILRLGGSVAERTF